MQDSPLAEKYHVSRTDGQPIDGRLFILSPDTDPLARQALEAYAHIAEARGFPQLAKGIRAEFGFGPGGRISVADLRDALAEMYDGIEATIVPNGLKLHRQNGGGVAGVIDFFTGKWRACGRDD